MSKRKEIARRPEKGGRSPLSIGAAALLGGALAAAGGWIAYSRLAVDHDAPLPPAVSAERKVFFSREAGRLSYYVDESGAGRPLVLIHSVNAAASAYEMRPLLDHYRGRRPVYALDLPGFGFSERSNREHSPYLYERAVLDFLAEIDASGADVVALSLGSEFAARAALAEPERFRSLVLLSPSGLGLSRAKKASQRMGEDGSGDVAYELFSVPVWARAFYDFLTTRKVIEFYLSKSFVGPVPEDLIDYDYAAAHQPGAEYAPLYFISGKLFTPDILDRVYSELRTPTLAIYDRDSFVSFDGLPLVLERNERWKAYRLTPTLGLPHWEKPAETIEAMDGFWQGLG